MDFKKGSTYTRDDIHTLYFGSPVPETGTGNWTSGYVRVEDELIVFMNINVPGTTGHDFPNRYDEETKTIEWFGKPNTNSKQPTFDKLIKGELTPHFFARWDNSDPFTYLGVGEIVNYVDGNPTVFSNGNPTENIKLTLTVENERTGQRISYRDFGDAPNDDPTELQEFAKRVRRGQKAFRNNLLNAYGSKCSITGEGPEEVLEAVHIVPHAESGINELDNGLLMRADLHYLFDDGLLSIHPATRNIELDNRLQNTSYWQFNGTHLRLRSDGTQISSKYLRQRVK